MLEKSFAARNRDPLSGSRVAERNGLLRCFYFARTNDLEYDARLARKGMNTPLMGHEDDCSAVNRSNF